MTLHATDPLPSPTQSLTIAANGQTFHALAAGPEDGPLVVLLHGFPETSHGWTKQIEPLAEAGLRVVAPDQRGIGRSSRPHDVGAYRVDVLAEDVVGLVRALGRERTAVVGHDWGGVVAWQLAARHADVVERAVILDAPHPAAFSGYVLRHPSQLARSWYMAFFQLPWMPEALLRARDFDMLVKALTRTSRPGAFSSVDLRVYREAWAQPGALSAMLNWYRALPLGPAKGAAAGEIAIPLRLLWGDLDSALEPGLAEASIAHCRAGEVIRLADATHWLHHEEPARVNALLLEFLLPPKTA